MEHVKALQITLDMIHHADECDALLKRIYNNQRSNSMKYGRAYPDYTFEQFRMWSYNNGFFELFMNYKSTGEPGDLPSVDRVDSLQGYSFHNNEWVTWSENHRRQSEERKAGKGSSGRQCRAVLRQKEVSVGSGSVIVIQSLRYFSVAEASRLAPVKVRHYLKTGRTDRNGYRWVYEPEKTKPLAKTKHEAETGVRYE